LNPSPLEPDVNFHWNATEGHEIVARYEAVTGNKWSYGDVNSYGKETRRIAGTAIVADLSRQTPATVAVTHYFDVERKCRDCGRPFIFFAEEQKHWYEELGFGLDSDCVRCVECRKRQQGIARQRELYETLFHVPDKTEEQCLEMADACLALIEAGVFTAKQMPRVRMLVNRVSEDSDAEVQSRAEDLIKRVLEVEEREQNSMRE
jgi:hypothetical protein